MIVDSPTAKKKKTSASKGLLHLLSLVDDQEQMTKNQGTLVEKVLISKLKAGDQSAFSHIFSAYYKDLVLFAMRYTKDLSNAEEIVQDTFVRLWEDHETVNISHSLKSYLLKAIQNKFLDWCRHKKIRQTYYSFVMERALRFETDTDKYVLQSELQDQIDAVLSSLPEEISSPFRMNRYKGLKYSEIADLLGVSVRTIEVRIGKALHMLRSCLRDYIS